MFVLAASIGELPSTAFGQMGTTGMAPPNGGVIGRAVVGLQELNANGPGYGYFGFNAADRGLGYVGSYMTVGAFIPYAQDDLGGFWSADLRTHLSVNGGFFSNVGAVRKQFVGGAILGVGVYWDYDGDSNQYPLTGLGVSEYPNATAAFGDFGHAYNQVGVSTELLSDWGNIRSNGYIPVGTTAYTAGSPDSPFYRNYVMCQYGLDAALAGADLELGVYMPGLADWAGMVSVGGYALGNATTNWNLGPSAGDDVVPWFGGVYTRLDMTFLENWDFSLQANNDSYFDWTGFARLTYRLGGSRRRNVPDQMEQPMMRNEHIVRAHQTPIVAVNPDNTGPDGLKRPWRVIHVDNSAGDGGDGTATRPFNTLADGNAAATEAWDIVYVSRGDGTAVGYETTYSFLAQNQYLVGDGASFHLPTATCGFVDLATNTGGDVPLLSNPAGTSIVIDGNVAGGATVANFQITGSGGGIYATGNLTGSPRSGDSPYGAETQSAFAAGATMVSNVVISGNGTAAPQTGVFLDDASGGIAFTSTAITNMNQGGLVVSGGDADVDFQGSITSDFEDNGNVANPLILIEDTTGGTINLAVGGTPATSTVPNAISDTGGRGIQLVDNSSATVINMQNVSLTDSVGTAILVQDDDATTTIIAGTGSGISKTTNGAAISVVGGSPDFYYAGPITNGLPATGATTSYLLSVADTLGGSVVLESPPGTPFDDSGNGILITNAAGDVDVIGATIASSGGQGLLINGGSSGSFSFTDLQISGASAAGVTIDNSSAATTTFDGLNINLSGASAIGLLATNNGGTINTAGVTANNITTASTTQPAVRIDAGTIGMSFATVTSAVPQGGGGGLGPFAMEFSGATSGSFDVDSVFSVGGTKGTSADYVPGGVTVSVPP